MTLGMPEQPDHWLNSGHLVQGGEWCQCYSIKYCLDLCFIGVWTGKSGAWASLALSPLFPGDIGHSEHYTFSAPNCWAVSSCTVNQLPSFTSWRHQLFRVSFVLRPTNDCTCKKPDELIMQTRPTLCSWSTSGLKSYQTNCTIMGAAHRTGLHGCQKDTWVLQQNKTGTCCIALCQLYLKDLEVLQYIKGD